MAQQLTNVLLGNGGMSREIVVFTAVPFASLQLRRKAKILFSNPSAFRLTVELAQLETSCPSAKQNLNKYTEIKIRYFYLF